jgi:8-amino-7-oxononanoate synthase
MLDFTSSLYLGFEHASSSLPGWDRLTLGKPAALEEMAGALQVQRDLAALTGCERVLLGSSTLHLFCDLFAMVAGRNVTIWIDEATYPIARWGTDRAAALGVPVRRFAHHDAKELRRALGEGQGNRPVIVTDGYSPVRGTHAPLRDYASCADARRGLLIVDDTQALGVFGRRADSVGGYGTGGGGSLQYFELRDSEFRASDLRNSDLRNSGIVVVSSLAKAFGAPVAMLGGSQALVERFHENSATLVHCSPPSAVAIVAAQRALQLNAQFGDRLRRRLVERVVRFRRGLAGLLAAESLFPVQSLKLPGHIDARALYRGLLARGVRSVLQRNSRDGNPGISFVLTARHELREVDWAVEALTDLVERDPSESERGVANHGARVL